MSSDFTRPGRLVIALAWAAALLGLALSWRGWLTDLTFPGTPWQYPHQMADFRDTVWAPGRWLLAGHNPYDPVAYLPANPGSQEFDPYAPAWFLLAAPLALLPFTASAALYLAIGAGLMVILLRLVIRTTDPRLLPRGVPLAL